MAIQLTITEKGCPNSQYHRSFLQNRIVIGRARSADICLPNMAVSTRHSEIRLKGNDYAVVDLDSLNGTEVNGKALVAHRPRILKDGDSIAIAGFRIYFRLGAKAGKGDPRDAARRQALEILANTGETIESETLIIVEGPSREKRFTLPPSPANLVIGRDKDAAICLDDRDVSRRHAEIVVEPKGVFVRDLDSRNGLLVDEEKVDAVRLVPGMHFKVGRTTLALEHPEERSLNAIVEAPEEMTSSFGMDPPNTPDAALAVAEAETEEVKDPTVKVPDPKSAEIQLPLGPADPLIPAPESEQHHRRTTGQIPYPKTDGNPSSDIGLIIVGALVLIIAVAGLLYIFS